MGKAPIQGYQETSFHTSREGNRLPDSRLQQQSGNFSPNNQGNRRRAGEVFNLKWTDVDFENRTVTITPEKGSNPRIFKFSIRLLGMLESLPKTSERIFSNKSLSSLRRIFERNRSRVANKLGNPRILKISFHTIRHWKATMEYHKTKDILHVMEVLGHRNIKNTRVYTQLVKGREEDDYVCRVAKTVEQAAELIEAGFDYVCEVNGVKLFRKRK
jgi:hypothetical protein